MCLTFTTFSRSATIHSRRHCGFPNVIEDPEKFRTWNATQSSISGHKGEPLVRIVASLPANLHIPRMCGWQRVCGRESGVFQRLAAPFRADWPTGMSEAASGRSCFVCRRRPSCGPGRTLTLKVKWSRAPLNATSQSEIYTKYIDRAARPRRHVTSQPDLRQRLRREMTGWKQKD